MEKSFNKILPSVNIMQIGGNTTIITKITKTVYSGGRKDGTTTGIRKKQGDA